MRRVMALEDRAAPDRLLATLIAVLALSAPGCASSEPSGVAPRQQAEEQLGLETSCTLAGDLSELQRPSSTDTPTVSEPSLNVETMDEQWARIAEDVPGGFAGYYLDT